MTLLNMANCKVLFEKLYTILRSKEPRRQDKTNFSFKMFKIMRSLRSSKYLKATVELTFTTQKAKSSPWTSCLFCFQLEIRFLGKFSHQTNLNMQNYVENMWCLLFLFQTRKTLFGQIWSKKSKLSVEEEIWYQETNLDMRNSVMILTFLVFDWKYLFVQI